MKSSHSKIGNIATAGRIDPIHFGDPKIIGKKVNF